MKTINLVTAKVNTTVQGIVAAESIKLSTARNNKDYLDIAVTDGTLTVMAKYWDFVGVPPAAGSILDIVGTVGEYNGVKQLVINRMSIIDNPSLIQNFIKQSEISEEELKETLNKYISFISDDFYKEIVVQALADHPEYYTLPAAKTMHHNFWRGLLQHSLEVCRYALSLADETVNVSLLITGSLLHDIGKCVAYAYDGLNIVITDQGKLLDHIIIGQRLLANAVDKIRPTGLSSDESTKLLMLEHIIASHHGKLEYGSPVVPKTREALLTHQADLISSRMNRFEVLDNQLPEGTSWSTYDRAFESDILVRPELLGGAK